MALVEIMRLWNEGVAAADKEDWSGALKCFTTITEPRAKISFNIGCCHLVMGNLQDAEKAFTSTVEKDKHLAVGFFQRGSVFFKEGKYKEALQDWLRCFTELRGNQLIDYKILGLTFKLYSCEILYNVALGHTKVGNWAKAEENLILALSQKVEPRHGTKIEKAMQENLKQKDFPLIVMPKGRLFYPNERLVEQLEKKDYLGKATVVASVVDKDSFSGFAPLQPQSDNPPSRSKTPEVLRTLQGQPHRVLFEFTPETIEEMEVLPGNIVFVLKKGDDNWATVLFNGKKGIVPCNYLEPVELKFQSQIQAAEPKPDEVSPNGGTTKPEIPAPPTTSAPNLPWSQQDKQATSNSKEKSSSSEKAVTPPSYLVKVYYKYTVAIQVSRKLSYGDLLILISSKLKTTPCAIKLSFRDGETDVPLTTDNVERAWELSTDNCLKLKCTDVHAEEPLVRMENAENPVRSEEKADMSVTALFDYEASQPEDLPFKKGDVIKVMNKVSEEWWEGECHDKFGIFPSAFVNRKSSM
ncbi:PREDICTED: neutrophil cytosol factor 2 [Nanorana parkeri]|uniref:neutrophil cytosol factor 2 n=1 Tax=Nanorana parkeri TaxID=125878 RepID=UPI0008550AF3|nr:PREDICTED: neutrophil cytosol factor 2 [Nanorana parkeri]